MKRFLAFHGDQYYPSGGWGDFVGDYDSKDEAVHALDMAAASNKPHAEPGETWQYQWAHVIDTDTGDEVWSA